MKATALATSPSAAAGLSSVRSRRSRAKNRRSRTPLDDAIVAAWDSQIAEAALGSNGGGGPSRDAR